MRYLPRFMQTEGTGELSFHSVYTCYSEEDYEQLKDKMQVLTLEDIWEEIPIDPEHLEQWRRCCLRLEKVVLATSQFPRNEL